MSKIIRPFDRGVAALAIVALIGGGAFSTYVIRAGETPSEMEESAPEAEESDRCKVDPNVQKEVIKEGQDFIRECKGTLKQAQRAKQQTAVAKINELCKWAQKNLAIFKNPPKSDDFCWYETVDEVRQQAGEVWDQLNQTRTCLELPKRFKEFDQAIKQAEKIPKIKRKMIEREGIDPAPISAKIAEFKEKKKEAQQQFNEGECALASATIDEIFGNELNPWQIHGAVDRYLSMLYDSRRICQPEIKKVFVEEVLPPLKEKIIAGNYGEVDQAFNEMGDQVWELLARAGNCENFRKQGSSPLQQKFEQLFQKFETGPEESPKENGEEQE